MSLPDEVSDAVSARDTGLAFLIRLDFLSDTSRVWTGFGKLRTLDGQLWDGLGDIISIDGVGAALSGDAPAGKLTVSGVSPSIVPKALGDKAEYTQRPVAIFFQAFSAGALVGNPCPLALRIMTSLEISRTGDTRSISINHESPYVGRNNPANGWYSDRDQQSRYPGDLFCEHVPFLLYKPEKWPNASLWS